MILNPNTKSIQTEFFQFGMLYHKKEMYKLVKVNLSIFHINHISFDSGNLDHQRKA